MYLLAFCQPLAAVLGAFALFSYVLVYTPLKVRTPLSTLVGAVPGAVPPLIGWAAARGSLERGALALSLIVFLWQVPHFLAIAWIYRDQYARAGFRVLPVLDPQGEANGEADDPLHCGADLRQLDAKCPGHRWLAFGNECRGSWSILPS